MNQYRKILADTGKFSFDYTLNGGKYTLGSNELEIETRWTTSEHNSIQAIDNKYNVAQARFAREFHEIDDPGALDFSNYTVRVSAGEIVVFRSSKEDYALVKIEYVFAGPHHGDDRFELCGVFQIRSL